VLPAGASALVASGLLLGAATGAPFTSDVEAFVNLPLALGFSTVAAGIWATRPDASGLRRLGVLYTVVGLGSALVFPSQAWAHAAGEPGADLVGGTLAAWLADWVWALGAAPLLALGLLLYPDGRLPGRRWWPAAAVGLASVVLLAGGSALDALPGTGSTMWSATTAAGFLLLLAASVAGLAALALRLVRAPRGSDLRGQIGAFLVAGGLAIGTAVIPDGDTATHLVLFMAAGFALPATVASAVVRHRLLDPQTELAARLDAVTVARTTLVTEREEERANLRRELHDGLGPSLAAIGLGMRRLQGELDDPAQQPLVTMLADEVQRAVGEVRRICDGLRPEAVDELGLVAAVTAAADRLGSLGGPSVTVQARPLPPLSPAQEAAAYRVVMEAATNAVRHADADNVAVRLGWEDGLVAEVEDDGSGIADGARSGVGLRAMTDRADELGGSATVRSRPAGGTVVRLWLPEGRA
jgi:signal transduction histidine kinase